MTEILFNLVKLRNYNVFWNKCNLHFHKQQSSWASPDKYGPKTNLGSPTWCSTSCSRDSSSSVSWVKDVFWPGDESTHFYFKFTVLNVKPEGGRWMVVQDVHTWVLSASNHLGQINFSYLIFLVDTKKGPTLCVFWVQGFKHEIKHTVDCIYTTDIGCFSQLSLILRGPFRFPFMNKTFKTRDMTVNWWLLW